MWINNNFFFRLHDLSAPCTFELFAICQGILFYQKRKFYICCCLSALFPIHSNSTPTPTLSSCSSPVSVSLIKYKYKLCFKFNGLFLFEFFFYNFYFYLNCSLISINNNNNKYTYIIVESRRGFESGWGCCREPSVALGISMWRRRLERLIQGM